MKQHEYLQAENYYESKSVGTGARSSKTCEHCGKTINKGTPHEMHHFYPEFQSYATHKECSTPFIESLRNDGDEDLTAEEVVEVISLWMQENGEDFFENVSLFSRLQTFKWLEFLKEKDYETIYSQFGEEFDLDELIEFYMSPENHHEVFENAEGVEIFLDMFNLQYSNYDITKNSAWENEEIIDLNLGLIAEYIVENCREAVSTLGELKYELEK